MKITLPDELDFIRVGRLPQKTSTARADGKIVLITGATAGVGYATARHFASMGATLIILVRNESKGQQLVQELNTTFNTTTFLYLADFEELPLLARALEKIKAHHDRIDLLINNAGAHRTVKKILATGIDAVFTVNHLASFLITKALIPLLEKSADPRIINVNSEGHRFGRVRLDDLNWKKRFYTGLRSYGASKSAQLHAMYCWKKALDPKGITINSMHPGAVKSNIGNHSGKLYNWYLKYIVGPTLKKPEISANAIYYLATSEDMKGRSGRFYNLTNEEKPAPHAQETTFSQQVFDKSMELIPHGQD